MENTNHFELLIKSTTDHVDVKAGWQAVFGRVKMVEVAHKCQWSRSINLYKGIIQGVFFLTGTPLKITSFFR